MTQREQGRVMPFGMSGARMRKSAQEYRRRGQALQALWLVRRAAAQDDTAASWQALAEELRRMGNWEVAQVLTARVLSRPDAAPSAWLDMARCMDALGQKETAEDCLYHLLHEDPWSPEGDAAREMLEAADEAEEAGDSTRVKLLSQRAMKAWHGGQRELGLRRMHRYVRLSRRRAQALTTLALLHMLNDEEQQAIRCLARALREEPDSALAMCSMAALLHQAHRTRMGRGFLRRAAAMCTDPQLEERFCTTAWLMDAWPELRDYLQARLKHMPYRIPLLHAKATMLHESGDCSGAQEVWKLILSVDPDDRPAATLLKWTQEHPDGVLPPGKLPVPVQARQREALGNSDDLFTWGSAARQALDWCVSSRDVREQHMAMAAAEKHPDRDAEIRWLRELLTRPDVSEMNRQLALMRLAALGHYEQVNVLLAGRYVAAQCQPSLTSPTRRLWHMFLPHMLRATRGYARPEDIVAFAARCWRGLSAQERQEAAGTQPLIWSRMLLVVWLWQQGSILEAEREIRVMRLSLRRLRRLARRFLTIDDDPGDAGEGDT